MERTRVGHCKIDRCDVYIGRPSPWGNPFSHKEGTKAEFVVGSVEEAVASYEAWIKTQPQLIARLPELQGKLLGCWCKTPRKPDAPCHGDVLARLADEQVGLL